MIDKTWSDGKYIYSLDLMFMYINNKHIVSKKIKTRRVKNQLFYKCWANRIAPIQVVADPKIDLVNWSKIDEADLRYPIFIDGRTSRADKFNIIDGMHRLAKAYLTDKKYVRAYVFDSDLLKKFILAKIGKLSKLPTKKQIEKIYIRRFVQNPIIDKDVVYI